MRSFEKLEEDYNNYTEKVIAKCMGYADIQMEHMPQEMKDASQDLAASCAVVYTVLKTDANKSVDIKYCAKRLKELSIELVDNVLFPDMIDRFCSLLDSVQDQIDDLDELIGQHLLAKYLQEYLEDAKQTYEDWKFEKGVF